LKFAFAALLAGRARSQTTAARPLPDLAAGIPPRSLDAPTGSQFAQSVTGVDRHERERAILDQLLRGNMPDFLRKLAPVRLNRRWASGVTVAATIFVMPEYLAIGSDRDFLRIPMNLHTARAVAERFNFVLPTKKIVDAIYSESAHRLTPQPLPPGPEMTSTRYYQTHNELIDEQTEERGIREGGLIAGHKKDVVLTNLLAKRPTQIAIYGWHRGVGAPIQPLSTVHGAGYADYSHGIRLVSHMMMIGEERRSIFDVLQNRTLADILSDEGSLHPVLQAWSNQPAAVA
jgi:hypothetical protein